MAELKERKLRGPKGLLDEHFFPEPTGLIDTGAFGPRMKGLPVKRPIPHHVKVKEIMRMLGIHYEVESNKRFNQRTRPSLSTSDIIRAGNTFSKVREMGVVSDDILYADMDTVKEQLHALPKEHIDLLHKITRGMAIREPQPEPVEEELVPVAKARPRKSSKTKNFFRLFMSYRRGRSSGV